MTKRFAKRVPRQSLEPSSVYDELKLLLEEDDVSRTLDSIEVIMVQNYFTGKGIESAGSVGLETIESWVRWFKSHT